MRTFLIIELFLSCSLGFFDNLLLNVAGSLFVADELAGEAAASLSHGTKVDGVRAHLSHGNFSFNDLHTVFSVHTENGTAALGGDVSHDVTQVCIGNGNLQQADGLHDGGLSLGNTILVCKAGSGLECHIVGVNGMVRAIIEGSLQADKGIAGENALLNCVAQTLFNGGEEVSGNGAAENFLSKDEVILLVLGLEANPNVTELTGTAGLLLVTAVSLNATLDLLAVSNTCGMELGVNTEAGLQLGAENVNLDITGAGDNHLVGLSVVNESEGNVFLVQSCKTAGDLVVLTLGLGRNSHGVAGLCQLDSGILNLVLGVANSITGLPLHLTDGNDVTAASFLNFNVLLAGHGIETAQLIGGRRANIAERKVSGDLAAHNLNEGVLTELIGNGLEYETGNGGGRIDAFNLGGSGNVVNDSLENSLSANAVKSIGSENGDNAAILQTGLDTADDLSLIKHHFLEVDLHKLFVSACGSFHKSLAEGLNHISICCGDGNLGGLVALGLICHIVYEVDNAGTVAHGSGNSADDGTVLFLQSGKNAGIIAVFFAGLGNAEHGGHIGSLEKLPVTLCADGNAVLGGYEDNSGLNSADSSSNVSCEVEVAGAVKNVNLAAAELNGSNGGSDGYLALDLFGIIVADSVAIGNLALTVNCTGSKQHALCKSGFTAVAMAKKAYIADFVGFVAHLDFLSLCSKFVASVSSMKKCFFVTTDKLYTNQMALAISFLPKIPIIFAAKFQSECWE